VTHDLRSRSLDVQRSKTFANNSVQDCRGESQQILESGLFDALLNVSKYDYGRIALIVSKMGRGQRSEGSGHNDLDSLKYTDVPPLMSNLTKYKRIARFIY